MACTTRVPNSFRSSPAELNLASDDPEKKVGQPMLPGQRRRPPLVDKVRAQWQAREQVGCRYAKPIFL